MKCYALTVRFFSSRFHGRLPAMLFFTLTILFTFGCANNPAVPLPPPDLTVITTTSPDEVGAFKAVIAAQVGKQARR